MTSHASLTDDLAALRAHYAAHMPADIAAAMGRADAALAASNLVDGALGAGEFAPDFTLPDAAGRLVTLGRVLRHGPVILTFYRGGWCPYCNLELQAYQALLPAMQTASIRLVAVSPQTPDGSASTVSDNGLGFDVVSDLGSGVARAYGIAFDLAEELRPLYAQLGHALPDMNGSDWVLPVPATFVIAPSGEIVLAFVDTDYRRRLDPRDAIAAAALVSLQRQVA
jgi:peroxiredoxin